MGIMTRQERAEEAEGKDGAFARSLALFVCEILVFALHLHCIRLIAASFIMAWGMDGQMNVCGSAHAHSHGNDPQEWTEKALDQRQINWG